VALARVTLVGPREDPAKAEDRDELAPVRVRRSRSTKPAWNSSWRVRVGLSPSAAVEGALCALQVHTVHSMSHGWVGS
jgi:hypothetical protein